MYAYCKLPMGLVLEAAGQMVTIGGPAAKTHLIVDGAAVTEVEDAVAEAWLSKFGDGPLVKNGLVFFDKAESKGRARAKEEKDRKSGMEPLNPPEQNTVK